MKLTVVGCSGSFPGPDSAASCYLLEADHEGRTWRLLIDLGNGALGPLQRHVDPLAIDAVFLSHLHADHCLDLCGYYVLRKYHPQGHQPRIPVWGPVGTAARMARAYDLPAVPGMGEEFDFRAFGARPIDFGPFVIEPFAVEHPVAAYALRVSADGATLTYSGDTASCEALTCAAAGADLFLAEASFRDAVDNPAGVHLTGGEAGRTATEAAVRRLVLTHIPPWHDPQVALAEARTTYAGPLELATPGATFHLSRPVAV